MGFAITPDGDIEAVFRNKQRHPAGRAMKVVLPQAIAEGGTKLDCYGRGLVSIYADSGFVPVARVAFNPEFANPGWNESKGRPDIYVMMATDTDPDIVRSKQGSYPAWTQAQLDALPLMEYDEAMAYRDRLLAQGDKAEAHTRLKDELKISAEDGKITSGAISGALNPTSKAAAKHTKIYYDLVRSMSGDCKKIASHTGFSENDIRIIKDYLFIEEHDLPEGHKRFYPSFEIAQSWQRLIDGKDIKPHDLTLLLHEILEKELMDKGYSQDEAHRMASKEHDYAKGCIEFYGQDKGHK